MARGGFVNREGRYAGLGTQDQVAGIDIEDPVHLRQAEDDRCPALGTLPPLNPVPDPRVTIASDCETANFTHRDTSSVVCGNTTAAGSCRSAAVPSKL